MGKQGYIKLWRSSENNKYYFLEPFTKWQAWVDLLLLANHDSGHITKRGIDITVRRGQLADGELRLADRWDWSRGKVRRFLKKLEKDNQITKVFSSENGTEDSTEDSTGTRRTKNDKNDQEGKEVINIPEGIFKFAISLNFPSVRGSSSKQKNISVIKARLADGYSPEEIKNHLSRFINRKQIHAADKIKYECDPDIGCKAWCPRLTWRILDVLSPERMDKYYSIWEAEGLLDIESTIEQCHEIQKERNGRLKGTKSKNLGRDETKRDWSGYKTYGDDPTL